MGFDSPKMGKLLDLERSCEMYRSKPTLIWHGLGEGSHRGRWDRWSKRDDSGLAQPFERDKVYLSSGVRSIVAMDGPVGKVDFGRQDKPREVQPRRIGQCAAGRGGDRPSAVGQDIRRRWRRGRKDGFDGVGMCYGESQRGNVGRISGR